MTSSTISTTATTNASSVFTSSSSTGSFNLRDLAQLNLTEEQRSKIRAILNDAKKNSTAVATVDSQTNSVLTTAQQTQLASLQNHGTDGGPHGHPPGPPPGGPPPSASGSTATSSSASTTASANASAASNTPLSEAQIAKQLAAAQVLDAAYAQYQLSI